MIAQIVRPYEEQRAHPRIVRGFALNASPETELKAGGQYWIRSTIIDISAGGCSFLCDIPVIPGGTMVLDIQFSECRQPFRLKGPVLRCEHNAGLGTYKLVVQFADMDHPDEFCAVLNSYISASF